MPWEDVKLKAVHPKLQPQPRLRLLNRVNGHLNVAARKVLFGEALEGNVVFQRDPETGQWSLLARVDGGRVNRHGGVTVSPITSAIRGELPVSLALAPVDGERRLSVIRVVETP